MTFHDLLNMVLASHAYDLVRQPFQGVAEFRREAMGASMRCRRLVRELGPRQRRTALKLLRRHTLAWHRQALDYATKFPRSTNSDWHPVTLPLAD